MPRLITKFSGLLSASGILIAILIGAVVGAGLTFFVITLFWGRPDLWPLYAG
jgi:hypothetical protein